MHTYINTDDTVDGRNNDNIVNIHQNINRLRKRLVGITTMATTTTSMMMTTTTSMMMKMLTKLMKKKSKMITIRWKKKMTLKLIRTIFLIRMTIRKLGKQE